jgi:hypothetical protein
VTADNSIWGNAYWLVLENAAKKFPDNPSTEDVADFGTTVKYVTRTLPCDDCIPHSSAYIQKNPPKPRSKKEALHYLCGFKNDVNQRIGKKTVDCEELVNSKLTGKDCDSCKVAADTPAGLKMLAQSKAVKAAMIDAYAAQDGIPKPDIIHEPCPEIPESSCLDHRDPNHPKLFLNPFTDSDRQVLHEYKHYRDYIKTGQPCSESEAQDFAYSEIKKLHPAIAHHVPQPGAPQGPPAGTPLPQGYAGDWMSDADKADLKRMGIDKAEQSITKVVGDIDRLSGRHSSSRKRRMTLEEEFPLYAMIKYEEERKEREEKKKLDADHHSLSMLDPIYEGLRKGLGFENVTAAQLNLVYTPQVITNVIMTLIESNFTPAGSGMFSVGLGLSIFVAGLIGRKSLSMNDQLLLQNLSGSFFWRTLGMLNPKRRFKESLKDTMDEFKDGHYFPFIETPRDYEEDIKEAFQAQQQQQAATQSTPGGTAVTPDGTVVPTSAGGGSTIGTSTTMTPSQYDLEGDDYYDDTNEMVVDEQGMQMPSLPMNIYGGGVDTATLQQSLANATAPAMAQSSFAREWDYDDDDMPYM